MCSVQISNPKKGRPERKLLPACQHPVEDGMEVTTRGAKDGYNPDTVGSLDPKQKAWVGQTADAINRSVGVLAEFLLADHRQAPLVPRPPDDDPTGRKDMRFENELEAVADALGVAGPRFIIPRNRGGAVGRNATHVVVLGDDDAPKNPRGRRVSLPVVGVHQDPEELDDPAACTAWDDWNTRIDAEYPYSARTVIVDHDRCILCDRCVRACSEDKPFKIIGHTGKGYDTRISFDLDRLMTDSGCVQCGQCMTYCPTGALSLRRRVQPRAWGDDSPRQIPQNPATPFPPADDPDVVGTARFLTADEMRAVELDYRDPDTGTAHTFRPFADIPYTFLKWNEGAVRERTVDEGETATLCEAGTYGTTAFLLRAGSFRVLPVVGEEADDRRGWWGRLLGGRVERKVRTGTPFFRQHDAMILGEMACLNAEKRTAGIEAVGPAGWYEVTRNVLDFIQRTPTARRLLDRLYTPRAIWACFKDNDLFRTALGDADRKATTDFLNAVGRPERWVYAQTPAGDFTVSAADLGRLWRELFRGDRIAPGTPITALGYDDREKVAKLAETDPAALGLTPAAARVVATGIKGRRVADYVRTLAPAAAARVVRELAGDAAFGRWFPDAPADSPRPGQLLAFLLVPPPPGQPHPWPPPGVERPALEFLLRLNPVQLRRVDAGQPIIGQDDTANDFYLIRLGFVEVRVESGGVARSVNHLGPAGVFGEVALLAGHPALRPRSGSGSETAPRPTGKRVASVVALDPTEVVQVRGPVFYLLCALVPALEQALLGRVNKLRDEGEVRKGNTPEAARHRAKDDRRAEYLQLGLYQGQKILALDLLSCTRCDECTRACADSHQPLDGPVGHARLLREGMRFGDFLVATSCRSCHKPYCMDGCPVDAIHRAGTALQVEIENHCIGCGLCEKNCPYGSIHMVPAGDTGERVAHPPRRAVNCDLCGPVGGDPYCVSACPHDAAFRLSGDDLLDTVLDRMTAKG